ncbi:hypothetical protein llap_2574 [Limosa lapponica baueri]|uniref:Rna-directed dna polymerase from mobile element jockey-like n=1 Tax=Limosa lapponica baueri TaxID=1758121 RepID=A0A2I0UM66_LIMLA|nr:hypothetical protein llap_2574 [Limosa lapponica baueri]
MWTQSQVQGPASGSSNPWYQYKLEDERIESSPAKKDLGILVDQKMDMSQQCVLAFQKANCILSYTKRNMASSQESPFAEIFGDLGEKKINRRYAWKTFSYERREEEAHMSIEFCVKSLHKLRAVSHIQYKYSKKPLTVLGKGESDPQAEPAEAPNREGLILSQIIGDPLTVYD